MTKAMKLTKYVTFYLFSIMILFPTISSATVISFTDPIGDHSGIVDIVGMDVTISDSSGNYVIDLFADSNNPFTGDFRININLFNVTQNEYFQDTFNDYSFSSSQTSLQLTGINSVIGDWLSTDTFATTSLQGLGSPSGSTTFRSSAADRPFQSILVAEDIIGYTDRAPIPEPTTMLLFGFGLLGLAGVSRRKK